jgi:hypothetical protein
MPKPPQPTFAYESAVPPVKEARQLLKLLRAGETADAVRRLIGNSTDYRTRVLACFNHLLQLETAGQLRAELEPPKCVYPVKKTPCRCEECTGCANRIRTASRSDICTGCQTNRHGGERRRCVQGRPRKELQSVAG